MKITKTIETRRFEFYSMDNKTHESVKCSDTVYGTMTDEKAVKYLKKKYGDIIVISITKENIKCVWDIENIIDYATITEV